MVVSAGCDIILRIIHRRLTAVLKAAAKASLQLQATLHVYVSALLCL